MSLKELDINQVIEKIMKELKNKGIPFEYTIDRNGFGGGYDDRGNIKDGRKHVIDIHIGDEDEFIQNGQVSDEKVMGLISTIFHEYKHLEQTEKYKYNPDFSKESKNIARMNAIQQNGLSNYYFENYRNDPKEVDATKYGIEEAVKYVKEQFPGIDADNGIVDYIQTYIQKDKDDEYGLHMFDEDKSATVEDILNQLQERMKNPTRVDFEQVRNGFIDDKDLKELLTDEFIEKYDKCNSVEEKDSMVLAEIIKLHPEILQEYPVLQNELTKEDNQEVQKEAKETGNLEVITEKSEDYTKEIRKLNGIEIASTKEFEDGSYDKKSRVFIADKGINVSSDYINYTTYRSQYDFKTNTYIDTSQAPIIDNNGNVIGEQQYIENYDMKNGITEEHEYKTIEDESGIFQIETIKKTHGDNSSEISTMNIDNRLSGSKEKIQYSNENGKETYVYMENGVVGQKITKTERGTTIDIYKDGKPFETFEYDEYGKAIIQMAGLEQLPDDYVKSQFDIVIPEHEVVSHELPEELYVDIEEQEQQNETIQQVSVSKLGKETLEEQKNVSQMDRVQSEMEEQLTHSRDNFQINEFGEIIRPKSDAEKSFRDEIEPQEKDDTGFRENLRVDLTTDERVEQLCQEFEKELEEGKYAKEEQKKKYDHKVEKGDNDYIDRVW